jgi:hypothetical protein
MLGAGHHVTLHSPRQRGAQSAEMMRVFAVGFLGAAPRRMAQQVDAHAAEIIASESTDFTSDGVADALFQARIPGRSARYGDRKRGSSVQNDAARPIGEADARNAETPYCAGDPKLAAVASGGGHRSEARPQRQLTVHQADLFVEAELVAQSAGALFNLARGQGFARLKAGEGSVGSHGTHAAGLPGGVL